VIELTICVVGGELDLLKKPGAPAVARKVGWQKQHFHPQMFCGTCIYQVERSWKDLKGKPAKSVASITDS